MDTPFSDIVVPLDGSPAAERALVPALDLVRRTRVPLRALRRSFPDETEAVAEYLATVADRYAGEADIDTILVERDSIPDAIIEGLEPGSLVCMSSHGRGGLTRAVIGSIAEALLRTLDRPTLVVGAHVTEPAFAGRIAACVDGSRLSEHTLDPALAWATLIGQPLWLLQVEEPGREPAGEVGTGTADTAASGQLATLGRRAGAAGWDVLYDKDPAHALVEVAASASPPIGLLVMASHGRSGWDRLRLGSVTVAVIHDATVPVLVVPVGSLAAS